MTAPDPLVPAEVDLRDFQFMPLDVRRLRDSKLVAVRSPEEVVAAILLWSASWHQQPASSLPDDDVELSSLAGYGGVRGVALFRKIKSGALYGFVLCADGRWYHPVVAEKAADGWNAKLDTQHYRASERVRKENIERKEKGLPDLPKPSKPEHLTGREVGGIVVYRQWKTTKVPAESSTHTPSVPLETEPRSAGIPAETTPKGEGQGEVRDRDRDRECKTPMSESPAQPPILDCPQAAILDAYRRHLPMLTQPRVWDGNRADLLKTRWRYCAKPNGIGKGYSTAEKGVEFWEEFFAYVAQSKTLTEGIPRKEGGTWKPDLPWLLKAENFAKVVEGKYHE